LCCGLQYGAFSKLGLGRSITAFDNGQGEPDVSTQDACHQKEAWQGVNRSFSKGLEDDAVDELHLHPEWVLLPSWGFLEV
jgi:hypothetical protein